ncbi:hypothetical protein [Pseudomonas solani]|uniref:hypothetical protein n=1 Tax=Pseudomonas solani TaxID=2731552 RepID=UPI003D6A05C2
MSEELEQCPFCGCSVEMKDDVSYPSPIGQHDYDCPLEGEDIVATQESWNRRHTPPAAQVQGEQPEVVGHLLLCAAFSAEEMGDIDVEWDVKVAERLQRELATADDVSLPLMTVAQHERIVAALSAPHEHGELWAVHAEGPDDLYAAFSREDAERHANELNAIKVPDGISISAVVIPSPWGAVEHWQYLAEQEREHVESMRAALSAPPAADDSEPAETGSAPPAVGVQEGWKLMPVQPNEAMLNQKSPISGKEERLPYWWYQALIKAAPTPPASEQQRAVVMPKCSYLPHENSTKNTSTGE